MNLTVAKFGGTSMGNAQTMLGCAEIILSNPNAKVAVVSATSGTTNLLIELSESAQNQNWEKAYGIINKLSEKHLEIAKKLNASDEIKHDITKLIEEAETIAKGIFYLREISPRAMDSLLSIGERISSILFIISSLLKN